MFAVLLSFVVVFDVSAQSEYFVINSFDSQIRLSRDRSAVVNERIDLTFTSPRHGIFRYIPVRYASDSFGPNIHNDITIIKVVDDAGEQYSYETYRENDNLVIKIGDPNYKVDGNRVYSITYEIEDVVRFYETSEEFVWDINGTGWGTNIETLSATVIWPPGSEPVKTDCFSGLQGASEKNCAHVTDDNSTNFANLEKLRPSENVTLALQFTAGTFEPASFWDTWGKFLLFSSGILLPVPVFLAAHNKWRMYGKDPKGRGVIPVQFDPPGNLTPAEVGTIADYRVDQIELSATLIDMAVRGYLQIIRTGKKKHDYSFKLRKTDYSKLKPHEKQLLEGIFTDSQKNQEVTLKSLKNSYYTTAEKVKRQLVAALTSGGYFKKNPGKVFGAWLGVGMALVIVGFFSLAVIFGPIGGWLSGVGIILSGIIVIGYSFFMPARTLNGVVAYEHIKGLKRYLEVAESDRLAMMQGPGSRYVGDTTAPKFTIELFEKLLPFAIVLGVEKQWGNKFKDIYTKPPDWYTGHQYAAFNSAVLASNLGSATSAISGTMISQPSSSSGSSFSGGGCFSGGGFGGGGGGSW